MFDDSKINQMQKASTSCPVPVRNEETADAKLDQEGKNRVWVILWPTFVFLIVLPCWISIEATALLLVGLPT